MAFWDVAKGVGLAGLAPLIGGTTAVGALAGSMPDRTSGQNSYSNTQSNTSGIKLGAASQLERDAASGLGSSYRDLQGMVAAGPGQSDVTAGYNSQRSLADMLAAYSKQGGADPTAQDISGAQGLAGSLFNPQRVAMQQSFSDQMTAANRQAALMGRDMNDPILRAKLAQEQTRQSSMLEANQGSWATQYATQQPGQRLAYAGQQANVLGGLATQAMANRQALAAMGQSIMQSEQTFRLNSGEHYSNSSQSGWGNNSTESGGGLKGALTGGLAGLSTGIGMAGTLMGMGGGGMMGGAGGYSTSGGMSGGPSLGTNTSFGAMPAFNFAQSAPAPVAMAAPSAPVYMAQPSMSSSSFSQAPFGGVMGGARNFSLGPA